MHPLAAYYVMVQTENERKNGTHRYASLPSRQSLNARIAKALGSRARSSRARSSRATAAQPA